MKILTFSDSHGSKNIMLDVVQAESPGLILHLGDNINDCAVIYTEYPEIPLRSVRGNNDFRSAGLDMDEFVLEGKRFFMTHGHLFNVKTGKAHLVSSALNRGVDVLLFGHTHIPYYAVLDDLTVINPGSVGYAQNQYAILEFKNGEMLCELKRF